MVDTPSSGKPDDNGKTPETLKAERAERFAKDPDSFVELNELILGVKVTPEGPRTFIGSYETDAMLVAQGRLNYHIHTAMAARHMKEAADNKSAIITPGQTRRRFSFKK